MKLINHVLDIRKLVQQAMDNRFSKMGIKESGLTPVDALPEDLRPKRQKLEDILNNHQSELEDYAQARQETINECTFTLFNRIAAIKVMEEKELFPEVIKRRPENGNKSFSHNLWLEENPSEKNAERQGLKHFLQSKFNELGENFPLYNENYPYSLMPTADELFNILEAFNAVENDPDCGDDIWKGDDILGWLYENFNAVEKEALKDSGEKTEYDKVSLQSQVYTPRWVVKFLVDNTLGKFYLEMFPDSDLIKPDENGEVKYKIANAPSSRKREPKKMEEIRVIDPACGSGNFLIYTFDLLYDMYLNQMEQYNADYSRRDIPRLILENNIFGVDLDERAVQLSQIALFIKSRELGGRRAKMASRTNVVSTHFFLPDYSEVESEFIASGEWDQAQRGTIRKIWSDLQNAHKFGSLVRVEEVLNGLSLKEDEGTLFATEMEQDLFSFKRRVTDVLHDQVKNYCEKNTSEYALTKAEDAMTFLSILSMPFDVVVANPPYTDSADYGDELRAFIEENYKKPLRFNTNLYASFIKRCCELAGDTGKVGMVNPPTFMYIKTFEDVRKYLIERTHINLFVEWGYLGMFSSFARVDSALFTLELGSKERQSTFIKLNDLYEMKRKAVLFQAYHDYVCGIPNERVYLLDQIKLKDIKTYPFIYWISDDFRAKFKNKTIEDLYRPASGAATSNNNEYLRFWWEVSPSTISTEVDDGKKWWTYAKGGPYKKWWGNLWLLVNWENDGYKLKHSKAVLRNSELYFQEGVTYSASGSKGTSFRLLPSNCLFDVGGASIFPSTNQHNSLTLLGFLNTKLSSYIVNCLNPTVNTQVGDISRIPFVPNDSAYVELINKLVQQNINIGKEISSFCITEREYVSSPITNTDNVAKVLHSFYSKENALNVISLLNSSLIDAKTLEVFGLSDSDRKVVLATEGPIIGSLPVSSVAKRSFIEYCKNNVGFDLYNETLDFIRSIPESDMPILSEFESLYIFNNGVEEYSSKHGVNPIETWYQYNKSFVLPTNRSQELSFELITDVIRTVLEKDDDGIIPLSDRMGEERLAMRIEQELVERNYNMGQINEIVQLLGAPLDKFLSEKFFEQLTEHLNLFMYLPKTPFIWHLSSGPNHAIDLYISIYKWDRNSLFRIKSVYAANREADLKERLSVLSDNGIDQMEANLIKDQLKELHEFVTKIDAILADGYDPKIDSGVGKNIAPLQKKGLISYDVLNAGQLKKDISAEW